jgi:hypothetical protein
VQLAAAVAPLAPTLTHLFLSFDDVLQHSKADVMLAQALPHLRNLHLDQPQVSDVPQLVLHHPSLTLLKLERVDGWMGKPAETPTKKRKGTERGLSSGHMGHLRSKPVHWHRQLPAPRAPSQCSCCV